MYTGNFENNYRHGFGELKENEVLKYSGYWINDNQVDEEAIQKAASQNNAKKAQNTQSNIRKK